LTITNGTFDTITAWIADKRGRDTLVLDLRGLSVVTDYFVLTTGGSVVQIKALAEYLAEKMPSLGLRLLRVEGRESARWILMDYGDMVLHLMLAEERSFYGLERLWGDAGVIGGGKNEAGTI
jgi:ribosome-associated protein